MKRLILLIATLTLLGGLRATSAADTPQAAGGAHQSMDDGSYVHMMLEHHQQGIDMAQMASERATRPDVKQFATRLLNNQRKETEELKTLEKKLSAQTEKHAGMDPKEMQAMMARLKNANGEEFDTAFLETMTKHHQQAVAMSQHPEHLKDPQVQNFAKKTAEQQRKDIDEMSRMRRA
jgi:uncharacterized protein (DUF305 family)